MTVTKKAYAKINLTLEILGTRRADGYHDIATVMHKTPELYDEVSVSADTERAAESSVSDNADIAFVCDADVCPPQENLAYRAAAAYLALYGKRAECTPRVSIAIHKHIPAGAGLAGGSADAAAVLDALCALLGKLSPQEIFDIALSLGSDVPFCLEAHTCALCTGRGEIMRELPPLRDTRIAVILPRTPLYTKGIYAEYDRLYGDDYTKAKSTAMAALLSRGANADEIAALMCNDFQPICEKRCPEIAAACAELRAKGYYAQMSGSGSAVFGLRGI